ncbi:MAG TPA: redoxin domain-containing protein [Planctomycetota bacterium]|nr:redoxin domain-containing protein [Planctomycetota bacterium]
MLELGQLNKRQADFAQRKARVIVVSMENVADAAQTQAQFPNLLVLADAGRGMSEALGVIHPHQAPDGSDVDAPTTLIVDGTGTVRWLFRPSKAIERLSPDEVLGELDKVAK